MSPTNKEDNDNNRNQNDDNKDGDKTGGTINNDESDRYSWTKPTVTTITMATVMETASSNCFIKMLQREKKYKVKTCIYDTWNCSTIDINQTHVLR